MCAHFGKESVQLQDYEAGIWSAGEGATSRRRRQRGGDDGAERGLRTDEGGARMNKTSIGWTNFTVNPIRARNPTTGKENQHWADARIPVLLDTPAAVRFVSVEPCLGPVDLDGFLPLRLLGRHDWRGCVCEEIDPADRPCIVCEARGGLDWVIVGGESGPKRRPFDVAWARSIAAQCKAAGVTCFAKQGSGPRPGAPFGDAALDALKEFPEVQL
jgi:hypothetical protein